MELLWHIPSEDFLGFMVEKEVVEVGREDVSLLSCCRGKLPCLAACIHIRKSTEQ